METKVDRNLRPLQPSSNVNENDYRRWLAALRDAGYAGDDAGGAAEDASTSLGAS